MFAFKNSIDIEVGTDLGEEVLGRNRIFAKELCDLNLFSY